MECLLLIIHRYIKFVIFGVYFYSCFTGSGVMS